MNQENQKEIKSLPGNDQCIDCQSSTPSPSWASVSNGTLHCFNCIGKHRGLGVHISFARSLDLDSWSEKQLDFMRLGGGNASFRKFVEDYERGEVQAQCQGEGQGQGRTQDQICQLIGSGRSSIRTVYGSEAASFYREILKAKVEGRPVPSIQELKRKEKELTINSNNKTNRSGNITTCNSDEKAAPASSVASHLLRTNSPSPTERFLAGLHYYSYRYITSPIKTITTTSGSDSSTSSKPKIFFSTTCAFYLTSKIALPKTSYVNAIGTYMFHRLVLSLSGAMILLSLYSIRWIKYHRHGAYKSCIKLFEERLNQGRIKRTHGKYDIYFPLSKCSESSSSDDCNNNNNNLHVTSIGGTVQKAILFFPESLIDVTSYCAIMSKLSDCGVLVVVVNFFEPTRVVCPYNNSLFRRSRITAASASASSNLLNDSFGIIYHIEKLMGMNVKEWIICGHGDGGDVALEARQLFELERKAVGATAAVAMKKTRTAKNVGGVGNDQNQVRRMKCVLWGLSKSPRRFFPSEVVKLDPISKSSSTVPPFGHTLFITASNDLIAGKFRFKDNLVPPAPLSLKNVHHSVSYYNIKNGNHSGFGHYGPQTFPRKDGNCVITIDGQQKECLMRTLDFIFEREPCAEKKD